MKKLKLFKIILGGYFITSFIISYKLEGKVDWLLLFFNNLLSLTYLIAEMKITRGKSE